MVRGADYFEALNNTILDFNGQSKINAEYGNFPNAGLIEPNTPIDLVAENDRVIRRKLITDFIKVGGDRISHGTIAKVPVGCTRFRQNVESSAEVNCNLVDSHIHIGNGGRLHLGDDPHTPIMLNYLGYHPLRELFSAPDISNSSWRKAPPQAYLRWMC